MKTLAQERRRFIRSTLPTRFEINLLNPSALSTTAVNFSEGGLCLRLRQALEVRSLIRFQLTPETSSRTGARPASSDRRAGALRAGQPVECTGRVAWVIQRLDLRNTPPFLYDVGIEFVDVPTSLRPLLVQQELSLPQDAARVSKVLQTALIRNRRYVPQLTRVSNHDSPWHLIVSLDGNPCFSGHYASERQAREAWAKFRRQQTRQR
jgi:hypothetical protein